MNRSFDYASAKTADMQDDNQDSLRILIINFEYPPLGGGGGVATQQIAEELAKRHEVHVITSRFKNLPTEEVLKGVHIHRVAAWGRRHRSAASSLSLLWFVPTAFVRGLTLCRNERFDVINAQFVLPSGLVAARLSQVFSIPLVVSFIGGDVYDPSKLTSPHRFAPLRWLIRWIARRAEALTAISEDTKRRVRELHGVTKDITVVPVGFSPVEAPTLTRKGLGLPEGKPLLISIGRLITRKRFDRLIEMLKMLPEVTLLIVGEGFLREQLENQASLSGVKNRVIFTGFVSEERKYQLLAACDIYVSAAEHEGFGIVFLEAMAAGLPIVAVKNGGQEDFLHEGENALLVKSSTAALLGEAVARLLVNERLCQKMSECNKKDVQQFTAEAVSRQFEQVLIKVTNQKI